MDFLYQDDTGYNFMNQKIMINWRSVMKSLGMQKLPKRNMTCSVCLYNERAVGIEIPNSVVLAVTETDPGHKGNTVTGATKPATLETGLKVNVPLHISVGDELKNEHSYWRISRKSEQRLISTKWSPENP